MSQQTHLYLHQLSQCASFAASHPTFRGADHENLPELRRLFAREVKRNLFEAYLRPSETVLKLVSTSISSSSSPGGEGMQFSASPRGHHILAYNSSRIYVIDVRGDEYKMARELKIQRKPASACIKDDGKLLAVHSSEMQVNLYDLEKSPPRHKQSIILDNIPRTIALSPCGSVLATAYDGGIEVSSLAAGALPSDKRAVKCDVVDALAFSFDGTQILGTTTQSASPSTVVLTAPYYDPGSQVANDNVSAMWTTSILFPNTSRDCSHAVLLQDGVEDEACWTFTYDRSFETFRAVRVGDLRNGTTYFTGPAPKQTPCTRLTPSTLPAATFQGDLVASGFQGKDIWVYGIPEDLDAVPETASANNETGSMASGLGRRNSSQSGLSRHPSNRGQDAGNEVVPQWRMLCDDLRNTLVAGRKIVELNGASSVKWVAGFGGTSAKERLVVGARGVSGPMLITEEDNMDFADGGRLAILDFDYRITNGQKRDITIEVGSDEAELLQEERRDLETEVAIVRRRTVAQRRGNRANLLRAATATDPRALSMIVIPRVDTEEDDPLVPRRIGRNLASASLSPTENVDSGDAVSIEEQEAMDAPYAHASPRSAPTLRRAATAAAVNRRLNPTLAGGTPVEYRRADGRAEHPHESDADNWVPPPPPYQEDDPVSVPAFLRGPAVAPKEPPAGQATKAAHQTVQDTQSRQADAFQTDLQRSHDLITRQLSHQRVPTDAADENRPVSGESAHLDAEDIYGVSPPGSPGLPSTEAVEPSPPQQEANMMSEAPNVRPDVPPLGLQIPGSQTQGSQLPQHTLSSARQLPNSQTWPRAQQTRPTPATNFASGYPYSAPASHGMTDEIASILPPLPTSAQIANLNRRVSQGNPHRLSGVFQVQRVPVGGRTGNTRQDQQQFTPISAGSSNSWQSEPQQPLIISTPQGLAGSSDPPGRRHSGRARETPILAPVPRHPRPNTVLRSSNPTVERLETIYSIDSSQRASYEPSQKNVRSALPASNSRFLPSWLAPASNSSARSSSGISRRPSRAERSAAKNIQDARRKGWKAKAQKNNKKKNKNADLDGASSTGAWTDVSVRTMAKEKSCAVM